MKTKKVVSLALLLAAGCGFAFGESTEPKLKQGDMPVYSEFARSHNLKGTVVVEALVDENGKVFAADVVQSVHQDLDRAALAAVDNWEFEPATESGKPVMKVVRIPINFDLIDPVKESLRAHDTAVAAKE
ncbi:MAG: energy transducer TonB [Oceanipulchritudo sp.]|jgi:TonB family protein